MEKAAEDPRARYVNRDASWLDFNARVLEEAADASNPLLERARFVAICVNNLDEFFMVRMAGLLRVIDSGYNKRDKFGWFPHELFPELKEKAGQLIRKIYETYPKVRRELEKKHIFLKRWDDATPEQKRFAKRYFESSLFAIATPMAVDQAHPFPVLPSKTTAFAVALTRYDKPYFAILPLPRSVPRLLKLPSEANETCFMLADEIFRQHMDQFFRGYKIQSAALFQVFRDSELSLEEEFSTDLLKVIENGVKKRSTARVVHLEIEKNPAPGVLESLCQGIRFDPTEVTAIDSELDLTYLFELCSEAGRPDLMYPSSPPEKLPYENIFDRIKEGDFLLHMPFQSFSPTADLLTSAAQDPNVLAIKMTLYRTGKDSTIIKALKEAAKSGKQVTVLVELKARFDEEKNIVWSRELEEAGCHVIYGLPGMKIHSKMALVVRREEDRIRRYVHLSTGNYNEKTARVYTDIGYFTANDDFVRDISDVFNVITGYSVPSRWKRIVSSPNDLRQYFFDLIDKEIGHQKKHKNGRIFAKMNSLEDPQMIEKLYEASRAGVAVRLIVRGICCLVPGVNGMSENIEVRSIVGRFLEHSRIYSFNNNDNARIFLSSADWMSRNLDSRIELLFEIYRDNLKTRISDVLDAYWQDTDKARIMTSGRTYEHRTGSKPAMNVQEHLLQHDATS